MIRTAVVIAVFVCLKGTSQVLAAEGECKCDQDGQISCFNDTLVVCGTKICSDVMTEFRLNGNDTQIGYKGENITIVMSLNGISSSAETNISVCISVKSQEGCNPVSETGAGDYRYIITNASKKDEGQYTFSASGTVNNHSVCSKTSISLYVHSTLLDPATAYYYSNTGENVTMTFNVVTDLDSWDNVTLHVTRPDGTVKALTLIDNGDKTAKVQFTVTNVTKDDYGEYNFTVTEITQNFGNTTYLAQAYLYGKIKISHGGSEGLYVVTKPQPGEVTCSVDAPDQNVEWWSQEEVVTDDSNSSIFQSTGTLHITVKAAYIQAQNFTCKSAGSEQSIQISVEGPPVVKSVSYTDEAFQCSADGNPLPVITWKLVDSSPPPTFFREPEHEKESFTSKSNLAVNGSTLCLGAQKIFCFANNTYGTVNGSTIANQDTVDVYWNKYISMSKSMATFLEANATCEKTLVIVENSGMQNFLTNMADREAIAEFYIGATRGDDGEFTWPGGKNVSFPQLTEAVGQNCSKYMKTNGSWSAVTVSCDEQLRYACEFVEVSPEDLVLTPDKCDGSVLKAAWNAPTGIKQQIEISYGAKEPTVEDLDVNTTAKDFQNLSPETEYTVKVSSSRDYCSLNTFAKQKQVTGKTSGPPDAPKSASFNLVNDTCTLAWTFDGEDPDSFWVKVTTKANIGDFVSTAFHQIPGNKTSVDSLTNPNSKYFAKIWAENCAGNGTISDTVQGCQTPIGAPPVLIPPESSKSDGTTIETSMPPANHRAGPISCQFLVVRYSDGNLTDDSTVMDSERFSRIKQDDANTIEAGDEYFAYATPALEKELDIILGNDSKSSCVPLPSSSKKKRSVQKDKEIKAWNRPIPFGVTITYFMVTTTPKEDNTTVYFAMSPYSKPSVLHERSDDSPSAAVIVLSVLISLVVVVLAVFLYRRCKRNKRSGSRSSFRLSYKATAADYDAL